MINLTCLSILCIGYHPPLLSKMPPPLSCQASLKSANCPSPPLLGNSPNILVFHGFLCLTDCCLVLGVWKKSFPNATWPWCFLLFNVGLRYKWYSVSSSNNLLFWAFYLIQMDKLYYFSILLNEKLLNFELIKMIWRSHF